MSFVSSNFLIFCLLFFALFYSLPKNSTPQRLLIFISGVVMYGLYSFKFLTLLLLIAICDYQIGKWIYKSKDIRKRKLLLTASICLNLGLLAYTKYAHFFFDTLKTLFAEKNAINPFDAIMPLGISFYTFESISYVVDIYRGKFKPVKRWTDYGAFLSYFPHLISGPIVRPREFLFQLNHKRKYRANIVAHGLKLILLGYFKKIVIADQFALIADHYFTMSTSLLTFTGALFGAFAFAIQIYNDFSAYTNIAQGLGYIIGIRLPENFNKPYNSLGFRDFWRRWHISLSSWLRDYLYIPLGGSKHGMLRTLFALMITMLLGGLWHGANLTFIAWGAFHGILLSIEHLTHTRSKNVRPWAHFQITGRMITFLLVLVSWVFFRSQTLNQAQSILSILANGFLSTITLKALLFFGILICCDLLLRHTLMKQFLYAASLGALLFFLLYYCSMKDSALTIKPFHYFAGALFLLSLVEDLLPKKLQYKRTNIVFGIISSAIMLSLILTNLVQARNEFIYFQF
jgi:alginate O-acetyltransferase complex protein AlgI